MLDLAELRRKARALEDIDAGLGAPFFSAADEIERLRELLRRADAVVTWETTPNGRGFQDEIEAALGIGNRG